MAYLVTCAAYLAIGVAVAIGLLPAAKKGQTPSYVLDLSVVALIWPLALIIRITSKLGK
jgi:hypothetical protein